MSTSFRPREALAPMPVTDDNQPCQRPAEAPDVESSSSQYARRFAGPVGEFFLDTQARHVLRLLQPWPEARVLDVGGGHGQLAGPLAESGFEVTVVGSSNVCRERLDAHPTGGSIRFVACRLLELPFPDDSFDAVLAFRLLPHMNAWRAMIAELCRVAKNVVIVDYPDKRSFNFLANHLFRFKRAIESDTRPFRCFRRCEVQIEFERAGFGRPTLCPQFFLPMALHRALTWRSFTRAVEAAARLTGCTRTFGSPVILRVVSGHNY